MGIVGGTVKEIDGIVLIDGFHEGCKLLLSGTVATLQVVVVVEPSAHGIAGGEGRGVAKGIANAATSSHGEACDGTMLAVAAIFCLGRWQEFIEEIIFGVPSGHVEVSIPDVARVFAPASRHDDYHGTCFTTGHELVAYTFHLSLLRPCTVVVSQAVEKVEYWKLGAGISEIGIREIYGKEFCHSKDFAVQ